MFEAYIILWFWISWRNTAIYKGKTQKCTALQKQQQLWGDRQTKVVCLCCELLSDLVCFKTNLWKKKKKKIIYPRHIHVGWLLRILKCNSLSSFTLIVPDWLPLSFSVKARSKSQGTTCSCTKNEGQRPWKESYIVWQKIPQQLRWSSFNCYQDDLQLGVYVSQQPCTLPLPRVIVLK